MKSVEVLARGAMALALAGTMLPAAVQAGADRMRTYVNPLDLPYRYQDLKELYPQATRSLIYREAADPTVVRFQGRYWMFPSHSKGYWHSADLLRWEFVEAHGYDTRAYAPTVLAMDGKLYLAAGDKAKSIWTTDDPLTGQWREAAKVEGYDDPCLFLDDDGRLYMYHGLSGTEVLMVDELDRRTFQPLRRATIPASRSKETRGWEVVGDRNENLKELSYVEGSWVTKHKGRYYLQYSAPGTQYRSYADGVLVADDPMGPFTYQPASPMSFKPTGFASGAGHGSTFRDAQGRWWYAGTMALSKRFRFERRLGLFPAAFTAKGELVADTYLGDYPRYIDGKRERTGWMLLSRGKQVTASSALADHQASAAVDEDMQTWWSAQSGDPSEWLSVDLGAVKRIEAVQLNFADQDSVGRGISKDAYRWLLELSNDGQTWRRSIDRSAQGRDAPHDYIVLPKSERARFVRLRNVHAPDGGKFSLYDLRVFGHGGGKAPARVASASATRDPADGRRATIAWPAADGAEFYVVRVGASPTAMNQNWQVYDGQTALTVASLNAENGYFVAVDAINENGVATWRGKPVAMTGERQK